MCIYIGIEDLVANALIELLEGSGRRSVFLMNWMRTVRGWLVC